MPVEMGKTIPSMTVIEDRMSRTYAARRQEVLNTPLLDLLQNYAQRGQLLAGRVVVQSELSG